MANRLSNNAVQKGAVATGREIKVDSMVAEEDIGFGLGLKRGTDLEDQVLQWDGANSDDIFAGFAKISTNAGFDDEQTDQYFDVSAFRSGEIYLEVDADSGGVTAGQKIAVMPSGNIDAQANISTGTGGTYAVKVVDSEIKQAGNAGDIVKVEIDMPCDLEVVQLA